MPDTPYSRNETGLPLDRRLQRERAAEPDRLASMTAEMSRLQEELRRLREAIRQG